MTPPLDQANAARHPGSAHAGPMRHRLADLYMFIRFPAVGFSVLLPLLGASTVSARPAPSTVIGLVAVALAFHVFAYVLNDVVDLPLDRTEPFRADYPLVRGVVRPGQALAIALGHLPLALLITLLLGGGAAAIAALLAAFALMTAYDLWGKRCPVPALTDAVQGLAWAALALYGALVAGGTPGPLTGAVLGYVFVYILLINGVHGPLRDLENDRRCGARTTALWLGARSDNREAILIPGRLRAYALFLQGALAAIVALSLARNWFGYAPDRLRSTSLIAAALVLAALLLLAYAARHSHEKRELLFGGMLHLVVTLGTPLVLLLPAMNPTVLVVTIAFYFLPVLAMWAFGGVKWG